MNFLETEDVVKQYANHLALDKVSIQVPEGKVFGLLGPNGAGKTTLIRIINRITAPDSGLVRFNGREFQPEDIYQIGYLPEERGLYKKMKVGEQASTAQRALLPGSSHTVDTLVRKIRYHALVEQETGRVVQRDAAENTIHHHHHSRTETSDLR